MGCLFLKGLSARYKQKLLPMKQTLLKALVLGTILLLCAPGVQARYAVDCEGCGHAISYDIAGDATLAIPENATRIGDVVRISNAYRAQLRGEVYTWAAKLSQQPNKGGITAAIVMGAFDYQFCDKQNVFDMLYVGGYKMYQILVDTVEEKMYINYGNGQLRKVLFGAQGFREPFAWERTKKKGSPYCTDSLVNQNDPCPDNWDVFEEECPDCEICATDTTFNNSDSGDDFSAEDSSAVDGDNLRLGLGQQGTFYDITVITDCDTIREIGHTTGGDTLFRDFRLHCDPESRKPDTVFLHEERVFQAEFRPMIELGQLTKLQLRFGGVVPVSRRFSVAAHGGIQIAPYMLDYGMRGSQFEDTLWSRGFYGFLGDIEAVYSLRPEKGFNPQLVLGVQGEFGTTELSGDRKSPSNQFSPINRVNISPYTQLRLEFGEVAISVGWNLFPFDYFNRWDANPDGGDRWWGGIKKPDLNFGLNVKF